MNHLLKDVMKLMSVSKKCQKKTSRAFFSKIQTVSGEGLDTLQLFCISFFYFSGKYSFLHNFSGYSLKDSDAISCLTFFTFLLYNRKGGELNFTLNSLIKVPQPQNSYFKQ